MTARGVVSDWRLWASVAATVLFLTLTLSWAAAHQEREELIGALAASTQTQQNLRQAATARIDRLSDEITRLRTQVSEQVSEQGRMRAQVEALRRQVESLGAVPVVVGPDGDAVDEPPPGPTPGPQPTPAEPSPTAADPPSLTAPPPDPDPADPPRAVPPEGPHDPPRPDTPGRPDVPPAPAPPVLDLPVDRVRPAREAPRPDVAGILVRVHTAPADAAAQVDARRPPPGRLRDLLPHVAVPPPPVRR